jgi:hypothetical protein
MVPVRVCGASVVLCLLAGSPVATAQDGTAGGAPIPVPPAVVARDTQGRVGVRATRIDDPPHVDGILDEALYRTIQPITGFIQQDPDEGRLATEPTLVWLTFDERNIYIGARCRDSHPERIVANDMRHDGKNVSANDNISIIIDTFHDRRNGYEFLLNSIGGAWDTQVTDERDANRDWNTVWVWRSRRDAEGWTVELAIPFRSLRYRGSGAQVWGINIRRNVRWKNELSYLSPVPRLYGARGILRLSQAATLVGLEAPQGSLNLDVKPYAVSSLKADRTIDPDFDNHLEKNAGFDLKYGITPSLTADATYRTDFSQVEDDDQQVNLTRFNLLYPEKRDFFLEGQGMFAFGGAPTSPPASTATGTPVNTPVLFFSRRIGLSGSRGVPIEGGARLTGKAGRYSIGLLDIQTDASADAGARATNFGIVRLKRNIFRRSYVGLIATRRSPAGFGGGNEVGGVDANLALFTNLNVIGYYAGTATDGLHGDTRSYRARVDYDADLFGLQIERQAVGRAFNPEVGFLRRLGGFTEHLAQVRFSRRPRTRMAVRKFNYDAALDYITDRDGRLLNREARVGFRGDMQTGDAWTISVNRDFEFVPRAYDVVRGATIPVGGYDSFTLRGAYTLGTQRKISGDLSAARGGFYDGTRTDAGYRGRVELSANLSIEPGVSINRVVLPGRSFTAKLVTMRATQAFSPRMAAAALVQYNSTTSQVSTNVRFRWEYRPMSEFFVVYSDGRDTLDRGLASLVNRGLTVKLTRLFRM